MAKVCAICGKKPIVGNKVVQSGKAKREGGVGKKNHRPHQNLEAPEPATRQGLKRRSRPRRPRLYFVHPLRPDNQRVNKSVRKPACKSIERVLRGSFLLVFKRCLVTEI